MNDLFGKHSVFYYYGEEHLFVNLVNYITEGIKNKEKIYFLMEQNLFEKLMVILIENNISTGYISYINVKDFVLESQSNGDLGVKKLIYEYEKEELSKGFSGVRYIGQPSHVIKETSKAIFMYFECRLTNAVKETSSSFLCIYDFYDYLNHKNIIDEEIIIQSMNTHTHILEKLKITSIAF